MNFILFWVLSVVGSVGVELYNELRIFKMAADNGYLINLSKMNEYNKNSNSKKLLASLFIPVVNLFCVSKLVMETNKNQHLLLDNLRCMDVLEYMDKEEEASYSKNPTGLNAISLSMMNQNYLGNNLKKKDTYKEENNSLDYDKEESVNKKEELEKLRNELINLKSKKEDNVKVLKKRK